MARFWRRGRREVDDLHDVEASPHVAFDVTEAQVAVALANLADPSTFVDGEIVDAETVDRRIVVTFGDRYDRRTALLRRLNALDRAGVGVSNFAWLDPVTTPDDHWLEDSFRRWEAPRHRDPNRIETIEVARRRFGRLYGDDVVDRLLDRVASAGLDRRRRRTIAHAATLAGFNTHTSETGDALVAGGIAVCGFDGFSAMALLDGARGVAELGRFGIRATIAEAPLVPLLEHDDWHVHGAATQLIAALAPPRSDEALDVLLRLAHGLAGRSKASEIRADQIVAALATAADDRTDVDDALDALRHHVTSTVRVSATTLLARRRPERARALWEPWLASRSLNERTAAEAMIAMWGDETDVPEVVRIVAHRIKPPKATTYWPPLAADGLDFLARHADVPDAAAELDRVRSRWNCHDADLRRWLHVHHPDLVPPAADNS